MFRSAMIANGLNPDQLEQFSKLIDDITVDFTKSGYLLSEIEYHYGQSDRGVTCLVIARRDVKHAKS